MKTKLERLLADRDIQVVEAIVSHLRAQSPRLVPTTEIAYVVRRSSSQVYALVKKAKELLRLTSNEFITNIAKRKGLKMYGYTVTSNCRAAAFEAMKSFDRAAGHMAQGITTHQRIPEKEMKTPEDVKLWLLNNHQAKAAAFFLEASRESKVVALTTANNTRLALAAENETAMPWETLGLENHRAESPDGDDIE